MAQERVKVEVVRSGGFAGLTRTASVDTDQLDDAAAEELRRLCEDSELGSGRTGAPSPVPPGAADLFQYGVTVQRGGRKVSFARSEPQLTPAERRLVSWVFGARSEGT